jgi:SH3-like domain-containing protein
VSDYLNLKGWVQTSALSSDRTLIVTRVKVMLRSGPGKGYSIVTRLYQGQILKYLGCYKSWYKVKVVDPPDGGEGWVKKTLVWG